jgi:hypothetical protein
VRVCGSKDLDKRTPTLPSIALIPSRISHIHVRICLQDVTHDIVMNATRTPVSYILRAKLQFLGCAGASLRSTAMLSSVMASPNSFKQTCTSSGMCIIFGSCGQADGDGIFAFLTLAVFPTSIVFTDNTLIIHRSIQIAQTRRCRGRHEADTT